MAFRVYLRKSGKTDVMIEALGNDNFINTKSALAIGLITPEIAASFEKQAKSNE